MSTQYKDRSEVPTSALVARLKEIAHAVTQGRDAIARECSMRVPAELDRDMDLVCAEAARRLELAYAPSSTVEVVPREVMERVRAFLSGIIRQAIDDRYMRGKADEAVELRALLPAAPSAGEG